MRSSGALALQHLPTELRCLGTEGTPVAGGATRAYWDAASIFRNAVERLGCATDEALAAVSLAKSDIDLYLCHQANKKIQFVAPSEKADGPGPS